MNQSVLQFVVLVLQPAEWMMSGTLGALAVVAAAVVRIYLGWAYVGNRLLSAAVEYEETGWSASVCMIACIMSGACALYAERQYLPWLDRTVAGPALLF